MTVQPIGRALGALQGSGDHGIGPSAGYAADLGFSFPLSVPPPPGVVSSPLYVKGLSSYNLFANVSVPIADAVMVEVAILRPDLTAWPFFTVTSFSLAVAGIQQVNFGSRGRDTNAVSLFLNFSAFLFQLRLSTTGGGTGTLSALTFACEERI